MATNSIFKSCKLKKRRNNNANNVYNIPTMFTDCIFQVFSMVENVLKTISKYVQNKIKSAV